MVHISPGSLPGLFRVSFRRDPGSQGWFGASPAPRKEYDEQLISSWTLGITAEAEWQLNFPTEENLKGKLALSFYVRSALGS